MSFGDPRGKDGNTTPILLIVRAPGGPAGRLGDRARVRNGVRCGERADHRDGNPTCRCGRNAGHSVVDGTLQLSLLCSANVSPLAEPFLP